MRPWLICSQKIGPSKTRKLLMELGKPGSIECALLKRFSRVQREFAEFQFVMNSPCSAVCGVGQKDLLACAVSAFSLSRIVALVSRFL